MQQDREKSGSELPSSNHDTHDVPVPRKLHMSKSSWTPLRQQQEDSFKPFDASISFEIYIGVSSNDEGGNKIAGFTVCVDCENSGITIEDFGNREETLETNEERAAVHAVLAIYLWLDQNCACDIQGKIYAKQSYVFDHLPKRIEAWLDSSRKKKKKADRDLLLQIYPLFLKFSRIECHRADEAPAPERAEEAQALAAELIGHDGRIAQWHEKQDAVLNEPSNDLLFTQALIKDRS
jgi:hypothetical protein